MHKTLTPVSLASLVLLACGGDEGADETPTATSPLSLVADCRGAVVCGLAGGSSDSATLDLRRAGTSCMLGSATELRADGAAVSTKGTAEWTSGTRDFRICADYVCVVCAREQATTSSKAGRCTGTAWSCSSRSAGSCSGGGCSFDSNYHPSMSSGYFTSECNGFADACSSFVTESSCEGQLGCSWK